MSDNFLDGIGSGAPLCDLSLRERVGTDYGDERSLDDMVENCSTRATDEDKAAQCIRDAHNGIGSPWIMKVKPLGQRTGLITKMGRDPGDSRFTFYKGEQGFFVDVEIKLRDYPGDNFRPRVSDVEKCIKYNRPYLLMMNNKTTYISIVFLFPEDLQKIQQTYTAVTSDKIVPYGGKPYFLVPSFKEYEYVRYDDLRRNGSLSVWGKMIKKLYIYRGD